MSARSLLLHVSDFQVELRTDVERAYRGLDAVWQSCSTALVPARAQLIIESRRSGDDRSSVHANGACIDDELRDVDVLPVVDYAIYASLARLTQSGRTYLHAATLLKGDRALMIAGASGAGKSSLAWAAIERGFRYAGDEIAVCDGQQLWGVPRAVLYDPCAVAAELPVWIAGADIDSYRFAGHEGSEWVLPLRRPPRASVACSTWPLERTDVVLASRGTVCSLTPAEPIDALAVLYRERWGDTDVEMSKLAQRTRCWNLVWDDPRAAAALLSQLVAR